MNKRLLDIALLSLLLLLGGCGAVDLEDLETQTAGNGDFSLTVPAQWKSCEPASQNGVLALDSGDGLELQVISQLGSMEYYSAEELCGLFADRMEEKLFAEGAEREILAESGNVYSCLLQGLSAEGQEAVCRIDLLMPYESVHYLLVYTAGAETYAVYSHLADQILQSFAMNKTAEEMYKKIDAERKAEAEQAARELRDEAEAAQDQATAPADGDSGEPEQPEQEKSTDQK